MQAGIAPASSVWWQLCFVAAPCLAAVCLGLPRSNASSAHWHGQDTSCPWRKQFVKEQLKARNHHMLKHQGTLSECITAHVPSKEGDTASTKPRCIFKQWGAAVSCKNTLASHRERHGAACSKPSYKKLFIRAPGTKNLRTIFPPCFWFLHLPTRHRLDTSEWSPWSKSWVIARQQQGGVVPLAT